MVGPAKVHSSTPGAGASLFNTRPRSRTSVAADASRSGQAARIWNHTLRNLWCECRGAGGPFGLFFRGPLVNSLGVVFVISASVVNTTISKTAVAVFFTAPGISHMIPLPMFRRHPALVTALIAVACHAPDGRHPNTLEWTSSGYPHKPISIMAPTNPGGGWDQTARLVQQVWTSERILPVPVEVTNRGGAGGTIGLAEFVSKNRNDPHTIMTMDRVMLGAIITNQSAVTLSDTVPLARLLSEYEVVAVAGSSGYRTFQQLIDDFKKDPKRISWGGGSAGGTDHILVGMIAQAAGVGPKNINYVAYSGGGEAAAAVMGGHVSAGVSGYGEWKAHVDAGKMRFLAVSSEKRNRE